MNKPRARVEDNHNRECSYSGDFDSGVVLHSAKLRNTVFLKPWQAKLFLKRLWNLKSKTARNRLIESYFE